MSRIVRLTPRFHARWRTLQLSGPPAVAVARTIGALAREELPGADDGEGMMPPVAVYWFRRVPDFNLWIWYAFDLDELTVVSLTNRPPMPIDG